MNGVPADPRRRHRRRTVLLVAVPVALAAVTAAAVGIGPPHAEEAANGGDSVAWGTVTRRTLSQQTEMNGALGYAGSYSVVNQATGIITGLPAAGDVVSQGQVLYRVGGRPVVLLYGSIPAYRTLSAGMSGPDVRQLNANLVAIGMATTDRLDPASDRFGAATTRALRRLQDALDVDQTGTLSLGQAVYLPSTARITTVSAVPGTQASPGGVVLAASTTDRVVTVDVDAAEQEVFTAGEQVTITLPDNRTTPGVVASVSKVADKSATGSGDATPTVTVSITPTNPADTGSTDQTTVTVSVVARSVTNVLTVPVNALLALAGGGYAVEVDHHGARRLVAVTLGLFDDAVGLVQVTGDGLDEGRRVVVPAS